MKLRIYLILVFFFFPMIRIQAQPGYIEPFDPAACIDSSSDAIFYGQVMSVEIFSNNPKTISVFENNGAKREKQAFGKITIQINKKLKSNMKDIVEVYLGYYIKYEPQPQQSQDIIREGLKSIFLAQKTNSGDFFLLNRGIDMSNFSSGEKETVISTIQRRLKLKEGSKSPVFGTIVRKINSQKQYPSELSDKNGLWGYSKYRPYSKDFTPISGLTVEAKQKESGKVYRTVTDKTGNFVFSGLPVGTYRVRPLFPKLYQELYVDYNLSLNTDICYGRTVFEMKKSEISQTPVREN